MINYNAVQQYCEIRRSFDRPTRDHYRYVVREALANSARRVRVALRDRVPSAPAAGSPLVQPNGHVARAPLVYDIDENDEDLNDI